MSLKRVSILPQIILFILSAIWIIPIVGILLMSVRPESEIIAGWWKINPFTFTLEAWKVVWHRYPLASAFINSMLVATLSTLLPVLLAPAAAYAYQYLHFPGRKLTLLILVNAFVLPNQVLILPLFRTFRQVGLIDNYWSVILPQTGLAFAWSVFMVKVFLKDFPYSIIEAARIDGSGNIRTFYKIVFPNLTTVISSVAILQFMWSWNDLLMPMLFLRANVTLPPLLARIKGALEPNWDLVAVASIITTLLPILVFIYFQKALGGGATISSGDKG